jgi:hypothetical protein
VGVGVKFPTRFPPELLTFRMGKDGIDLLIDIKKRPNFQTQRDCKIQDEINGNSLGNRCPSLESDRRIAISDLRLPSESGH